MTRFLFALFLALYPVIMRAQDYWTIEDRQDLETASSSTETLYLEFIGYTPDIDSLARQLGKEIYGLRLYSVKLSSTKSFQKLISLQQLTIFSGTIREFDFNDLPSNLSVLNLFFKPKNILNEQMLGPKKKMLATVSLTGRGWSNKNLIDILQLSSIKEIQLEKVDFRKIDISCLSPNIKKLTLVDCNLDDLISYELASFNMLTDLVIYKSKLKKLEALEKLPSLRKIEFVNCGLSSAKFINRIPNLRFISLRYNKLCGEVTLNNPSVELLDLSYNEIRVFGLENHTDDFKLDLSYNKLDSVYGLESDLEVFYFLGNDKPIRGLQSVEFDKLSCFSFSSQMTTFNFNTKEANVIYYQSGETLEVLRKAVSDKTVLLPWLVTYGSRSLYNCEINHSLPSIKKL